MQISDQICRCHKDWKSARSNRGWAIPAPEQQTWKPGRMHLSCDTSGRRRAALGGCSSCTLWSRLGEMLPPGGDKPGLPSRASPAVLLRSAARRGAARSCHALPSSTPAAWEVNGKENNLHQTNKAEKQGTA